MPKSPPYTDAERFGRRLVQLLEACAHQRRGAGAYLAAKYGVSNVTANAWLNGEYKPAIETARQIAEDHRSTFDALYFGAPPARSAGPEDLARTLLARATPRSHRALLAIIDAAERGKLDDADIELLGAIAKRFQSQ